MIWWDGRGACLLSKRPERGRFVWPSPADGKVVVTPAQLAMLLEGTANLVAWPKVFERNRRTILSAGMIAVRGCLQREGEVVHLVAQRLTDLSAELASVGERGNAFPLPHGRGGRVRHGGSGRTCAKRRHAVCGHVTSTSRTCNSARSK